MASLTIGTAYEPATYRYAHHLGSGEHLPAVARAWDRKTGASVEVSGSQYPDLDQPALIEKAVAILRRRHRAA